MSEGRWRIRHIWEGTARGAPIRIEQRRAFPFRARTGLLVRGELVASADTGFLATMKVRLVGEYDDAEGRVEVVAMVRGDEGFNAENLCTLTCNDRKVVMHVVQTRWLSAQSGWLKLLVFLTYLVVDSYVDKIVGYKWVEFVPLALFVCAILIADAVPAFPASRSTKASA